MNRRKRRLADLGAGGGERISDILKRKRKNWEITGIELPAEAHRKHPKAKMVYEDAIQWLKKQPNQSIDVINADYFFNNLKLSNRFETKKNQEILESWFSLIEQKLTKRGRIYVTGEETFLLNLGLAGANTGFKVERIRKLGNQKHSSPAIMFYNIHGTGSSKPHRMLLRKGKTKKFEVNDFKRKLNKLNSKRDKRRKKAKGTK